MAYVGRSFWQIFRIIFVLSSVNLLGDAVFRWSGFRYYASFSEFLPSVALATILWIIVAVFFAVLVWLLAWMLNWLNLHRSWKFRIEHVLLFICIFVLLEETLWISKRIITLYKISPQIERIEFSGITFTSIFLTWLFHKKAAQLIISFQERITPLVWLFGIGLALSVPLVAYHTLGKQTIKPAPQESALSYTETRSRPNIILVTFDALTTRDMSVYDYRRPTTPFIRKWAERASLFTKLEAESNITTPTTASLMTGKRLWSHQTYHIDGSKPVRVNVENLPLLLQKNGYYNMAFIVNYHATVNVLGIAGNFDIAPSAAEFIKPASLTKKIDKLIFQLFGDNIRLHDWILKGGFVTNKFLRLFSDFSKTDVPPEEAFNRLLRVLDNTPPEPFFAWIHLLPPHDPYLPPEPYMGMFDASLKFRTHKEQCAGWDDNIMRARYDEFIRYCDTQFEDFITQLTMRDKLKNTVVIISADHGESFEHNYRKHSGPHLYEQVTHIPLIIKQPGQNKGQIINNLAEQIDIPPTILELADIPVPSWMEGRSLTPLMRGEKIESRPAFSMTFQSNRSRGHQITSGTIAVWEGSYKLIHYLKKGKSLLFNLEQDPGELNNLFDKKPDVGQRLLALIQDNLKKANEKIRRESDNPEPF